MPLPEVHFDDALHRYTQLGTGKVYLSATTIVGKYKPKKDWNSIAHNVVLNPKSKYYGQDPLKILADWEKNKEEACTHGTAFHQRQENRILAEKGLTPVAENVPFPVNARPYPDLRNIPDGPEPELRVWDHYWGIAGTVDLPIFDGDFFDIADFKTSREIDLQSYERKPYYNRVLRKHIPGGHDMMNFPLNHIQDCNFRHYELQLSLYAYMIERLTGKKARNLTILHHPRNRDTNEIPEEPVRYPCEYKKNDVELLLQHYFQKPLPDQT